MDKTVKIISKDQSEDADIEYWKTKSAKERLEAVQILREQWIEKFHNQALYDESRKGLRRFYKVSKRSQS